MKLAYLIKRMIRDYFIIFAIVVMCISVMRFVFSTTEYYSLKDIFIFMLFSLVADLPSLILYSPEELPEKRMRLRIVIHFAVLEAVLLILANVMDLVNGTLTTVIFAIQIAVIYILVRLFTWMFDSKEASNINERIRALKNGSVEGPEDD